ncbi:hypothetical protein [Arenimonas sp.]|uniref:hypothetical protein n=1 Tax=Arenimonas sp. TaxID=1872635 RepID=UPI0039E58B55
MKLSRLILVLVVAALAAGTVDAQRKKEKKLYRWVDKEGKVHYVDALPADAVDRARTEYNSRTGNTTAEVSRALTPEERVALAEQMKSEAEAKALAEQQHRSEEAMLSSYATENDLRGAYDERISLLKQTLESTDVGMKALRGSLASLLAEASESELSSRAVNKKRAGTIRDLHNELVKQQVFQKNRQAELMSLDAEFVRVLARYRELRAVQTTPPATSPAAPPGGMR